MLKAGYDEKAVSLFGKSRLRDRMDAIIAHEYEERRNGMSHVEALKAAPKTALPIREGAREISREMERIGLLPISWSSDNGSHLIVGTVDEGSGRSSSIGTYLSQVAANSAGV